MKLKAALVLSIVLISAINVAAADPKLEGAYRFVGLKFQGGGQTDAEAKGMIVVHGKYMAFVKASVGRQTWEQSEAQEERAKKIIAAYQGLAATCGTFEVQGNIISLQQLAQASPGSMGTTTKWEYKLDGKMLTLKPVANPGVEFSFERLP
ncbi:MAG TPA: lipocalin-like domain-containing protein [Blastocatellia bacterium]|nr:lipocalin-like domain-containing protein [Blastocatellia bacterium]